MTPTGALAYRVGDDDRENERRLAAGRREQVNGGYWSGIVPLPVERSRCRCRWGGDAWRKVRRGTRSGTVVQFLYQATVLNDNTVRLAGIVFDGETAGASTNAATPVRGVDLRQLLDSSWRVYLGDTVIATAAGSSTGELRALRRRRRPKPSAASGGKLSRPTAPSVSPTEMISSRP